jgi:tetratricopeptide (TPR) repeat protein
VLALHLTLGLALAGAQATTKDFGTYYRAARELHKSLYYERALEQLGLARAAAKAVPDQVAVAMLEGLIRADMGQWDEAKGAFKTALMLDPSASLPREVSPKVRQAFEETQSAAARAAAEARPTEVERPAAASGPSLRLIALAPAALALIAVVTGAVLEGLATANHSRLENAPSLTYSESVALRDSGSAMQTAGWVCITAAVVAAGVAAVMFLVGGAAAGSPEDSEGGGWGRW